MEHLGLTTASTRSDSSRKLPPRCDLSSTFSIIFPVQVAVWGYWKCSSSEFSVDRVHHSYRFSFGGGSPYPTPFLGVETLKHSQHGLKHPRIPISLRRLKLDSYVLDGFTPTSHLGSVVRLWNRPMARNDGNNPFFMGTIHGKYWQIILQSIFLGVSS